jgi:hypothetical protein
MQHGVRHNHSMPSACILCQVHAHCQSVEHQVQRLGPHIHVHMTLVRQDSFEMLVEPAWHSASNAGLGFGPRPAATCHRIGHVLHECIGTAALQVVLRIITRPT